MGGGGRDVCGNCGAPWERDEDGRCRWCQAGTRRQRPRARPEAARERRRPNWRVAGGAVIAVLVAVGAGLMIADTVGSGRVGPPSATRSAPPSEGQGVPPGSTDLQNLRQDFGPWRQVTGRAAEAPGLLLLNGGAVTASRKWAVPIDVAGWAPDLGGNVSSVAVSGGRAAITDADGVSYTIGAGQPFIIASNPGTVLQIRVNGTVLSMSLAQATAVRKSL